jgi:23S rRNA (cytosine1962-C5)-methyltransferase
MSGEVPVVRLQPKFDRRCGAGHPWIFANEVRMDGAAKSLPPGTCVRFEDAAGRFLAHGYFNPHSLIVGRVLSRDPNAAPASAEFYRRTLGSALRLRDRCFDVPYYRLVHAEADQLPGLIVDRYGEALVVQINCAGASQDRALILAALQELTSPETIILHQEGAARRLEGLPDAPLELIGRELQGDFLKLSEGGLTFLARPITGQKTGWFYDQRDNRAHLASLCRGKRMIDFFTHTGGFALYAANAGAASVTGVDASAEALGLAEASAEANGLSAKASWIREDVFDLLAELIARGERYDVVAADPPAFIKSRKDHAAGLRGYRKLAKLCAQCVASSGILLFASCSHHAALDELRAEIAAALQAAGRTGRIIRTGFAALDHPQHPMLPESAYLKVLTIALD